MRDQNLPKHKRSRYALPVFLDLVADYKPGDPRPEGYNEFFAWAEVQDKAGIKQTYCRTCRLWLYPQEPHPHQ